MYGKHHSEETKEILRKANVGKQLSQEHIEKLKKSNIGRTPSQDTINRIGDLNRGKKLPRETVDKMLDSLCQYEYRIILNKELQAVVLGHTRLYEYCKENFNISRTIVEKIINNDWIPTFKKHKWLEGLEIQKIKRCID